MIQILLEQRQQVLDEHVEMVRSATSQGGLRMDKLFRTENDAPHASLELAGGQEAEIAIREKILENFRKIEETFRRTSRIAPVESKTFCSSTQLESRREWTSPKLAPR